MLTLVCNYLMRNELTGYFSSNTGSAGLTTSHSSTDYSVNFSLLLVLSTIQQSFSWFLEKCFSTEVRWHCSRNRLKYESCFSNILSAAMFALKSYLRIFNFQARVHYLSKIFNRILKFSGNEIFEFFFVIKRAFYECFCSLQVLRTKTCRLWLFTSK